MLKEYGEVCVLSSTYIDTQGTWLLRKLLSNCIGMGIKEKASSQKKMPDFHNPEQPKFSTDQPLLYFFNIIIFSYNQTLP